MRAAGAGDDAPPGLDIVGLGALNVDLIAARSGTTEDEVEDTETAATLQEIRTRCAAEPQAPQAFLGGSAFNTIVMLAQLDLDLRLGMVGVSAPPADGLTESHAGRLRSLGIADLTFPSQQRPGMCLALSTEEGRRLHTAPEANLEIAHHLRADGNLRGAVARARILHLTSLLEDPDVPGSNEVGKSVAAFVEAAKTDNPDLLLSFDPGRPWVDGLEHLPDLRRIYALADVLYVNPDEWRVLRHEHGSGNRTRALHGLCPDSTLIIVKPLREIVVRHANGLQLARVPRLDEGVAVDPTGAGDAVAAGVLAAIGTGRSVVDGCRLGLRLAVQRVSDFGDRGHADLRTALREPWPSDLPRRTGRAPRPA